LNSDRRLVDEVVKVLVSEAVESGGAMSPGVDSDCGRDTTPPGGCGDVDGDGRPRAGVELLRPAVHCSSNRHERTRSTRFALTVQ
jgi:hypothetical protein